MTAKQKRDRLIAIGRPETSIWAWRFGPSTGWSWDFVKTCEAKHAWLDLDVCRYEEPSIEFVASVTKPLGAAA